MDRTKYLKLAQKASVGMESFVLYDKSRFIPVKYIISFDNNGNARHSAELHDVKANSLITVPLEKVESECDVQV